MFCGRWVTIGRVGRLPPAGLSADRRRGFDGFGQLQARILRALGLPIRTPTGAKTVPPGQSASDARDPVAGSGLVFGLFCMDFDCMDSNW